MQTRTIWVFTLLLIFSVELCLAQTLLDFTCTLWDANTGIDLKSVLYGVKKGVKMKIAFSDNKQKLLFKPVIDLESLVFESEGFKELIIPINFIGLFNQKSEIQISLSNSGYILQGNPNPKDYLLFSYPNDYKTGTQYELNQIRNGESFFVTNLTAIFEKHQSFILPINEKLLSYEYIIIVKSNIGEVLEKKAFYAKKGLNVIDGCINPILKKTNKKVISETSIHESIKINNDTADKKTQGVIFNKDNIRFKTLILLFEQTSYELSQDSKNKLDDIVKFLLESPQTKIKIKGFTDNIGDRKLNEALAEFRAKVVNMFILNKGIGQQRIMVDWEKITDGKNLKTEISDLDKQRRVVITEQ